MRNLTKMNKIFHRKNLQLKAMNCEQKQIDQIMKNKYINVIKKNLLIKQLLKILINCIKKRKFKKNKHLHNKIFKKKCWTLNYPIEYKIALKQMTISNQMFIILFFSYK